MSESRTPWTPSWPVAEGREQDLYFYLQSTEGYGEGATVKVAGAGEMLMLGSYSYLGLNGHPAVNRAAKEAIERYGTGTQGVRLLAGTLDLHKELEARIAAFKETQAALVFSSGYMANVSTIACLFSRGDTIICDKLDHASIVDGCALSGADFIYFRHNDLGHLEARLKAAPATGRRVVVVDAVFSMDGDVAPLPEIVWLCRRYGALVMTDEAHSIGVLGATGRGVEEHFGLPSDAVDIKVGTLSKAIPSVGGYVAGPSDMCEYLAHQARGFIYSAALPAPQAAAALAAFNVIEAEPERVARLHENMRIFRTALDAAQLHAPKGDSAIFPILCGDDWDGWRLARHCHRNGLYVQCIPYPVVPKGSARLRASVTSEHSAGDLDRAVKIIAEGACALGVALRAPVGAAE